MSNNNWWEFMSIGGPSESCVNCALVSGITREYTIRYCPILLCCHLFTFPCFPDVLAPRFSPDFPHFAYICLAALLLTTSITCANKLQQTFAQNSSLECPQPTWLYPIHFHHPIFLFFLSCVCVCVWCGIRISMQMSLSHLGNLFENTRWRPQVRRVWLWVLQHHA